MEFGAPLDFPNYMRYLFRCRGDVHCAPIAARPVIPMAHSEVAALAYFWTCGDSMVPASDRCCTFGVGRSALSVIEPWTVSDGCDGGVFDRAHSHMQQAQGAVRLPVHPSAASCVT